MTLPDLIPSTVAQRWEIKLSYPRPPLNLNQRLHWAAAHKIRTELAAEVGWLLKAAKIPPLEHAAIWLEWTPNVMRRRDTDNPEPTRKVVIDAIVAAGLLPDDTPAYCTRPETVIRSPQVFAPGVIFVVESLRMATAWRDHRGF